jgi:hypothetical protein
MLYEPLKLSMKEYISSKKDHLLKNVKYNKELIKQLINDDSSEFKLIFGAELEIGKTYHIKGEILQNGLILDHAEGNWLYNIETYNYLYRRFEGMTKDIYNNLNPYYFGLDDDKFYTAKEVKLKN